MIYKFKTNKLDLLNVNSKKYIISDSINYHKIKIEFDDSWTNYSKTINFYNTKTNKSINMLLNAENECIIPYEVLEDKGNLVICVRGVLGTELENTLSEIYTLMDYPLIIVQSDKNDGSEPSDPTEDIYDQIVTQLGDKADGLKYVGTKLSLLSGEKELSYVNINSGESGGTSDYNSLENKPSVNGIELIGNKTTEELGLNVDLSNYATKEEIPNKTSSLTNDSNFVSDENYIHTDNNFTNEDKNKVNTALQSIPSEYVTETELENKGYITEYTETDPTVPTYVKEITQDDILNWDNKSNFSGSYNDLTNKPNIPTKTSGLTNDSNFVSDENYIHTDNNFTDVYKNKVDSALQSIPSEYVTEIELENYAQPKGDYATNTQIDNLNSIKADKTEIPTTLPASDVYEWAKQSTKPTYSASEVGALSDTTVIPTKTSELTNDNNFVSDENYVHTDNNFTNEDKGKISTNTSNITLLDSKILKLSNYIKYFPNNVVGLHADFQNMEFYRLAGAENLTMGADFNKFNMYGCRKRCLLADDGVVIAYNDGTKYICNDTNRTIITLENGESGLLTTEVTVGGNVYPIGTQIQVMVEQPKFYYKVVPIKLDEQIDGVGYHLRSANYYVTDYEYSDFKLHPCFYNESGNEVDYIYLSAYEGCAYDVSSSSYLTRDEQVVDFGVGQDKISSIANVKPMSGLTQQCTGTNLEQIARNRGNGWHSLLINAMSAEQLLMAIEMGGFNSQSLITYGIMNIVDNSSYNCSSLTGSTKDIANGIGKANSTINEKGGVEETLTTNGTTSVNYRGVENDWGNIFKLVYGVNIYGNGSQKGGIPYICSDYNFAESKNSGNYNSVKFTLTNVIGYVSSFGYSQDYDYLFFPSEATGSTSLPIGDYESITSNLNGYRVARLGGSWNLGVGAGVFSWYVAGPTSSWGRSTSGRLLYIPQNK